MKRGRVLPPSVSSSTGDVIKRRRTRGSASRKANKKKQMDSNGVDLFDFLPDDLILLILIKLCSSASCPADIISISLTCKRMCDLLLNPMVLVKATPQSLTMTASNWCEHAHNFLKRCSDAGNPDAYYLLGMIRFYCLRDLREGANLLMKAAATNHAEALYSISIILFNAGRINHSGAGMMTGISFASNAIAAGHVNAKFELGHYVDHIGPTSLDLEAHHPVNRFLVEWFAIGGRRKRPRGIGLCGNPSCGRTEMSRREFRECPSCRRIIYCSRGCQAIDWGLRHLQQCDDMRRRRYH